MYDATTARTISGWAALSKLGMTFLPYGVIVGVILAIVATLEYRYPVAYVYFIYEDGFVENSTAAAFALAAVLLVWESRRSGHWLRRGLLIAVAAGAGAIVGEEISWGQRIFGITTPEVIGAVNAQGEFNLHNIEALEALPKYRPLGATLLMGLALSIVLGPIQRRSDAAPVVRALPLLQPALAPLVLLTAWILAFQPFVRTDEIGEWLFGLCLLAWAANLASEGRTVGGRLLSATGIGAIAAVMLIGAGLAATFPPKNPAWRLSETAESFAKHGLREQSEQIIGYIQANPQYVEALETNRAQCSARVNRNPFLCR
jgi:hypothetical protein